MNYADPRRTVLGCSWYQPNTLEHARRRGRAWAYGYGDVTLGFRLVSVQ